MAITEERLQTAVWMVELGRGRWVIRWLLLLLLTVVLSLIYSASQFRGLENREAMDQAQLARHIARGEGFTTSIIRPLSVWHLQNRAGWSIQDKATHERMTYAHPDLVNPPLYPLVLGMLLKLLPPTALEYKPEERLFVPERWVILPFNQLCLAVTVLLMYLWARQLFDRRVAILSGVLLLFSDTLWSFGVSGLHTNFLMLLLMLQLFLLHQADRRMNPGEQAAEAGLEPPRVVTATTMALLFGAAVLMGLCVLTSYRAAWLLLPLTIYVGRIMRQRQPWLWMALYLLVSAAILMPWFARNYQIARHPLGVAHYELVQGRGAFVGDTLHRSLHPDFKDTFSLHDIASKFLLNSRPRFEQGVKLIGTDFLVAFFLVGIMYGFRRRDVYRLRGVIIGGIVCCIVAEGLLGFHERDYTPIDGGNLMVLWLPAVMVYGAAFFFLLLDRISFRIRLTRALAVGLFAFINLIPIIYTLLPPRRGLYPYPPYVPPVTHMVASWFEKDEVGCTDLPWAMAWIGDRRVFWLPTTIEEFYELHDIVSFRGVQFVMLTPYMLDSRLQSQLIKGEYKGWSTIVRGQLPTMFPLRAGTLLPPENEQLLFAARPRWSTAAAPESAEGAPSGTAPSAAENREKTPPAEPPKP